MSDLNDYEIKEDAPLPPDPLDTAEERIKEHILGATHVSISLALGAAETNPARALRIVEELARHQRELLADLGTKEANSNRVDVEFEPLSLSSAGGTLETFGAQLIKEIVPLVANRWGNKPEPLPRPSVDSYAVGALQKAIREAKRDNEPEIEKKLREKLDQVLASNAPPTSSLIITPPSLDDYLDTDGDGSGDGDGDGDGNIDGLNPAFPPDPSNWERGDNVG